jgi:hypothetical protein
MALGESTLRLVLGGSPTTSVRAGLEDNAARSGSAISEPFSDAPSEPLPEPGFADIEAAVALVSGGFAARVVLASFPSWPGLLWRAYELADEANVLILPTVVRPGGYVDVVITREKPE